MPFICKPISPEPTDPPAFSIGLILKANITCLNHPRIRCQTTRIATVPQSPLKWFKMVNLKPTYPASLIACCRNYNKGSGVCSSHQLFLSLNCPSTSHVALWAQCATSSWELWAIDYLFKPVVSWFVSFTISDSHF